MGSIVISIAVFDLKSLRIPNVLNLALLLSGLMFWTFQFQTIPIFPTIICTVSFGVFCVLRWGHYRASGRIGMGFGDVKMLGASGAWVSPFNLPFLLMAASGTALIYVLFLWFSGADVKSLKVPFGVFIGLGLFLTWGLQISGTLNGWEL